MQNLNAHTRLKQTAELYLWGLKHFVIDPQEVWRWCEEVVRQGGAPESVVRAVQSPRRWDDSLKNALEGVPGECDQTVLAREGFGVLHRTLAAAPREQGKVLRLLRQEPFRGAALGEQEVAELAYLQKQRQRIITNAYAPEASEAASEELTANVLSFLECAARGSLDGYVRRETAWPRAKKTRLFYLSVILAVLSALMLGLMIMASPPLELIVMMGFVALGFLRACYRARGLG